jgi:CRISPR system Cascade subunit CasD
MAEFLVFTLTAPMGAFGDLAGHERRGTLQWPGKSAILGLVGAALGIRRDDRPGQAALRDWQVAVSVLSEGVPLRDYHTVQTVPSAKAKKPDSRRVALAMAGKNLNTIITQRDYLSDICFGVALWADPAPMMLPALAKALQQPLFTFYLGRKSCPLSAPLAPLVTRADTPMQALQRIQLPGWLSGVNTREPILIASDPFAGVTPKRRENRWDIPLDRQHWHFAPRIVEIHNKRS